MFSDFFNFVAPYITPVIIFFGIANAVVLGITRFQIKTLSTLVHPWTSYGFQDKGTSDFPKLVKASDRAAFWYTVYANITAIFPLMGIFGTVCSLLRSSSGNGDASNFFVALDTTVWGLVFAMGFKLADSFISSKLDRALDESDYQIHKLIQEAGSSDAQAKT